MPAPKATSHGLYGAGAAALTFMSAASAGVASATAATADKMNFFICCPSQLVTPPGGGAVSSERDLVPVVASTAPNNALGNVRSQYSAAIAAFLGESHRF